MSLRHLQEPILRKTQSPILSFLAPSVFQIWQPYFSAHAHIKARPTNAQRIRHLSSSSADQAGSRDAPPSPKTAAESGTYEAFRAVGQQRTPQSVDTSARLASPYMRRPNTNTAINEKLDKLFPGSRPGPGSSASDAANAFTGTWMSDRRKGLRSGDIANSMLMPNADSPSSYARQVAQNVLSDQDETVRRNKRTLRSRPAIGRTVEVEAANGVDLGQALRRMEMLLARNRVRKDLAQQKFHERGGMKRKRLKRERWRKYFQEGFRATVGRVKQMRRQGW